MRTVRFLESELSGAPAKIDRWYVTDGTRAVGPVAFDLLARGIESGRVPIESYVRHEGWRVWKPLADVACVYDESAASDATEQSGSATLAPSARARAANGNADKTAHAPEAQSPGTQATSASAPSDGAHARPAARPSEVRELSPARVPPDDSDPFALARDDAEAALLLLSGAARACSADGAIFFMLRDHGAEIACAHGPRMFEVVGEAASLVDPVAIAAASGLTLVAEPTPGPAGGALLARQVHLGAAAAHAAMIPVGGDPRIFGWLELGKSRPFTMSELAAVEGLAQRFSARLAGSSRL